MPKFQSKKNDLFIDLTSDKKIIRNQVNFDYGIYYWFINSESLNKIVDPIANMQDLINHNLNGIDYVLVYLGIGPRNMKTKKQFIKDRLLNCHLGNKMSNSTFREAIASSLRYSGYQKQVGQNLKYFIPEEDEKNLTSFIISNFLLAIREEKTPWNIEKAEIDLYRPPLNIQHNSKGWNVNSIKRLRKEFRDRSKLSRI